MMSEKIRIDREVNGFKVGDVIFTTLGNTYEVVENSVKVTKKTCSLADAYSWFKTDLVKGFYPAGSYVQLP